MPASSSTLPSSNAVAPNLGMSGTEPTPQERRMLALAAAEARMKGKTEKVAAAPVPKVPNVEDEINDDTEI